MGLGGGIYHLHFYIYVYHILLHKYQVYCTKGTHANQSIDIHPRKNTDIFRRPRHSVRVVVVVVILISLKSQ